jgi:dihydroorotase
MRRPAVDDGLTPAQKQVEIVLGGGTLVHEWGEVIADIAIDDGRIVPLGAPDVMPPARQRIDVSGQHILPGIIDVHVHFRDPGMTEKEDWTTGSQAAAVGGVTCVFDMPNTIPPTDSAIHLQEKLDLAGAKSLVDFGIYGLLATDNLDQLRPMAAAGAIGFKLFLGNTTGHLPTPPDGVVLEGFEIIAELGKRCTIHAENCGILEWREARLQEAGRVDPLAHLASRPEVAAVEALNRSCTFAEWTGARIHIAHETTARSLDFIRFWKDRGIDMTVEVLPQHLHLAAEDMLKPGGEALRINPPIRERANQGPLWRALADGTIDMLSTDHAPHTPAEKAGNRIWDVACGLPSVETSLPLMLTAVAEGRLGLTDLVRATSAAPARAFGVFGRKGVLAPGADADLVVVDREEAWTLTSADQHSRSAFTPYDGRAVKGRPKLTMVRGRVVAQDGEPVVEPGWGRPVEQGMGQPHPKNLEMTTAANLVPNHPPFPTDGGETS